MLCDPRTESLIEIYIEVVPPIKQARAQLNSVAAFARPDGPGGAKRLHAAHPPPILNFHKGRQRGHNGGRTAREAVRSGNCVTRRAGPYPGNPHAMNKLLTLAASTSGPVNVDQNKAVEPGREPKTFWRDPSLHPHITDADRFSISAIKVHCKRVQAGSVEERMS